MYYLIPFHPYPYEANIAYGDHFNENSIVQFYDLNSDGLDERIVSYYSEDKQQYSHVVLNSDGTTKDQLNNYGVDNSTTMKCFIGDYNHDGYAELFSAYMRGRQVFVRVFSPYNEDCDAHEREIMIYDIPLSESGKVDLEIPDIALIDLYGGKNLELVMILYGRYDEIDPRRIFAVEIDDQEIRSSPSYGNIISSLVVFDHNLDGIPELTGIAASPNNNKKEQDWEFPDSIAWLMVFDNHLELATNTPSFPGPFTIVYLTPVRRGDKTELAGFMKHDGSGNYPNYMFETRNLEEIIIRDTVDKRAPDIDLWMGTVSNQDSAEILVASYSGTLLFYDQELNFGHKVRLDRLINLQKIIDLNQDGKDEIILMDVVTKETIFLNHKGKLLTRILFDHAGESLSIIGETYGLKGQTAFCQNGQYLSYFTLQKNHLFYLQWLILVGLIGFFLGLAFVFKWIQRKQIRDKELVRQQLNTLQLQSLKNQLDPHFTFNALNVLTYLSGQNDNKGVESFSHHFSRLLRSQLEMSDQPSVKLHSELQFVRHYIELQKLRFDIPVKYDEDISIDVDMDLKIPKMMIHTHVENAIKHGLIPAGGGEIRIHISKEMQATLIQIQDNGAGRKPKQKTDPSPLRPLDSSTGKGLAILNQLYDLYYQLYKVKIKQEFVDLKDKKGNPKGTIVKINL